MPARDLPCSSCGAMMWRDQRFSLPEGQATCLPCRRKRRAESVPTTPQLEQRFCRICQRPFDTAKASQVYCSAECRNKRRGFTSIKAATANERGYGKEHREARAKWKAIVEANGGIDCCICGDWVEASERWHLDHTPERDGYRGVAHALCNVRDGASRGARRSNLNRAYTKGCPTCGGHFTTTYPKQTYCSAACRPKPQPKAKQPRRQVYCMDCGAGIKQGKRCAPCGKAHARNYMRNRYRVQAGIPLDTPKWDRSWRVA